MNNNEKSNEKKDKATILKQMVTDLFDEPHNPLKYLYREITIECSNLKGNYFATSYHTDEKKSLTDTFTEIKSADELYWKVIGFIKTSFEHFNIPY